ncbi:MAG: serine protease, partial [Actinomycetota bacterium]|nr:serine protease [Actinomycetota bacterium]
VVPTVPPQNAASATTTTKPPEILNADGIAKKAGPSVWSVSSLDEAGRPVEGSGFVAGSFGGQTYLLTSLSIVQAATRNPGPDVVVHNGGTDIKATLWTWQEERDLALLVIGRTAPSLTWADQDPGAKAGDKVFVPGGGGSGVLSGVISAISPAGIEHNITVDDNHLGAPMLNDRGQILGILTRPPGSVGGGPTALPVSVTCERVLSCGSGNTVVPAGSDPAAGSASTTTTLPSKGATSTTLPSRSVTTTTLR